MTEALEKNIRKVVPYVPGEQPQNPNVIKLNTNEYVISEETIPLSLSPNARRDYKKGRTNS